MSNTTFKKTINLWDDGVQERILSGELKLQSGQYVICGNSVKDTPKARFVGIRGNSLWVAHPEGKKGTKESFPRLLNVYNKK